MRARSVQYLNRLDKDLRARYPMEGVYGVAEDFDETEAYVRSRAAFLKLHLDPNAPRRQRQRKPTQMDELRQQNHSLRRDLIIYVAENRGMRRILGLPMVDDEICPHCGNQTTYGIEGGPGDHRPIAVPCNHCGRTFQPKGVRG